MNPIRRICRSTVIAAGLAMALLTSVTLPPAANAIIVPARGGPAGPANVTPTQVQTVAAGGMPGWQITLIAVGAAIVAAAVAVLLDRARIARRHVAAPS